MLPKKKSPNKSKSLQRKLTISLILVVTLVSSAVSLLGYLYLADETDKQNALREMEYAAYFAELLEWPLWNLDDELIGKLGSTFAANNEIAKLTIYDDQMRIIFSQGMLNEKLLKRKVTIKHEGKEIGSVEFSLALDAHQQQVIQQLWSSVVTLFTLIVSLLLTTGWILSRLFRQSIATLLNATQAIVDGNYKQNVLTTSDVEFKPILLGLKTLSDAVAVREADLRQNNLTLAAEIEERKKIEGELRNYKEGLEEVVEQRTSDLILARNAAETANRAKSVFLSNMNHELRTPLNAILGFSNLLRQGPSLSSLQKDHLDIINRSGDHLLMLINDALEVAKIEAGRMQLEDATFDLGNMVRDITDMMSIRAETKGLQLIIDQTSEFPRYIMGDEARLRQILINLVGNAIKFTEQGYVSIRLTTKENAVSHLLIEVEDSGVGVAEEDQQRLFEPFIQLGSEHGVNQGTGLGLTITRQYVEMMGGSLTLQSSLNKGSLFMIDLPLKEVIESELVHAVQPSKGSVLGLASGQPSYRILIVEDQLENQLLLTSLIENVDLQCKVAENGEQGVQLFQDWHPHLIFMDRRMPVMDGIESTKAIRQLPNGTDVKIVAVTASAFIEQRSEMIEAGMDDVVRKPYRFNEIYECLSDQLGLEFIYESEQQQQLEVTTDKLTPEMLSVLPDALQTELKVALESLDRAHITDIIEQITEYDSNLKEILKNRVENFDYPSILNALSQPRKNH